MCISSHVLIVVYGPPVEYRHTSPVSGSAIRIAIGIELAGGRNMRMSGVI